MNSFQRLWWEQARSDHGIFVLLRRQGSAQCHQLHYLQMTTEKIAKAYFWRSGSSPPKKHSGFRQFLKFLGQTRPHHRARVASLFRFKRFPDFQNWINSVLPIVYDLEHLAPDLANDGPNPEYPWPHRRPTNAPVLHDFDLSTILVSTGPGRRLTRVIQMAVDRFPEYADT
jgi:hypothetical protein